MEREPGASPLPRPFYITALAEEDQSAMGDTTTPATATKTKIRITAGSRDSKLWIVINAFDKFARGSEGALQPWRSRQLGRVEHALRLAGWTDAAGTMKPVHLRSLSSREGLDHHEARGLAPERGLFPHDRANLRSMAEKHQPRVMVLVGDAALEAVTGHKKASKYAGSVEWVPDMDCWVVAIEDPFVWMMDHTKFHAGIRDLRKAVKIAAGEEPVIRRAEVTVLREFGEAMIAVDKLRLNALAGTPISCDIEAWGGIMRSIAWSTEDFAATVLPLASIKGSAMWAQDEESALVRELLLAFAAEEGVWIYQNAIFDQCVMHDLISAVFAGTTHDTMARHNVLYPDQPKNLGFLVRWYLLWDTYHKDDAKAWKPNSNAKDEDLWQYNGVDADTTRRVAAAQDAEPGEVLNGDYAEAYREHLAGLPELYEAIRDDISLPGICVNRATLAAGRAENQLAIGEFAAELSGLLQRPVWVTSPTMEDMRAELDLVIALFGLTEAFAGKDGTRGTMTAKRKAYLAMFIPALLPGQAPPVLAAMIGAGVSALDCVTALATGKLPQESFCFARKAQVKELLYGELGLKEQEKRRVKVTGETSTSVTSDTAALKELLSGLEKVEPDSHPGRIITCLLALASLSQLEKAYFSAEPSADGRFRGAYNIAGTTTRRFACNAWHDGTGFNLMTFPRGDFAGDIPTLSKEQGKRLGKIAKSLKCAIIPDAPDHVIVNIDGAQAEARVVAFEAREVNMIKAFGLGIDFHAENTRRLWGYATIAEVSKLERQRMKIGGHGSNYKMGIGALARDMHCSYGVAKAFQLGYYAGFPNIELWHQALRARLHKGLPLVNAFGWPRICHEDPSDSGTLRTLCAHGPQSVVPMVVNRAWLLWRAARKAGTIPLLRARIMMQTHDSLTASVHKDDVDAYNAQMRPLFNLPIPVTTLMGPLREGDATSYTIPCDFEVGLTYGDMERWLSERDEERVLAELAADENKTGEQRSDAEIAEWCGVNKDAVAAVRAGKGRDWWRETAPEEIDEEELSHV